MAKIFTGAKAKVNIVKTSGAVTVAFASGINVNQENTLTDIDILGQLEVGDLAETGHRVNASINSFKIIDPEIQQSAELIGLDNAILESMRDQEFFDVVILDNNDQEVYKLQNCKFEGGTGNVDARGVWNGTWNVRAKQGIGL